VLSDLVSGENEEIQMKYVEETKVESGEQLYTMSEVLKIVQKVLQNKETISPVIIKQEAVMERKYQVPVVTLKTIKDEPISPSPQLQVTTTAGGKIWKVPKKDFCIISLH
jgi:hypothetical protein